MIPGEEAMMTADHLIIMMTVAGMTMNEDATTENATTRKIAMMIGQQDPRMAKDGVEDFVAEKRFTFAGKDGRRSGCFPVVYWTSPIVVVLPSFTGPRVILYGQLPSGVSYGVAAFSGLVLDPVFLAVQRLRLLQMTVFQRPLNGSAMVWFLVTGLVKHWPAPCAHYTWFPS